MTYSESDLAWYIQVLHLILLQKCKMTRRIYISCTINHHLPRRINMQFSQKNGFAIIRRHSGNNLESCTVCSWARAKKSAGRGVSDTLIRVTIEVENIDRFSTLEFHLSKQAVVTFFFKLFCPKIWISWPFFHLFYAWNTNISRRWRSKKGSKIVYINQNICRAYMLQHFSKPNS